MIEIWRDIKDYEGLYQVSNWGRVRSLHYGKERILKPGKITNGYLMVSLSKDRKTKSLLVHRLVAEAFIPNPQNLPIVNHRNENKENNFVFVREDGSVDFTKSNLEWCDYKYSINYGTHNERSAKARSKPVFQYTLDGEFIREWSSTKEVQRQTGWSHGNISACCRGHKNYSHAYGFIWIYK